jgi:UDP-3-O-[3-hydroxymyristoyl] glucosamine N-acyltransferase
VSPLSLTLQEIAARIGATVEGNPTHCISGVADLEHATPSDLSFYSNPKYHPQMVESRAGAIVISGDAERPAGKNYLVHQNPSAAFQAALAVFLAARPPLTGFSGVHPTAVIHPTASLGAGVTIGPYVVVDQEASIGDRTTLCAFTYIGPKTSIGDDCTIHPHVTIREGCVLGNRVIIQPGAVIGSCGYGYLTGKDGRHTKLDQLGNVVLKDDVEIGANTTLDRARFQSTVVGEGTKIDNQVQIAHNVTIGKHALIVAQVGIAGSAYLGNHVVLGGQCAVNGHIDIADGVRVTACSGISKSLTVAGDYGGVPVLPLTEYNRNAVYLRRIGELYQRVKALELRSSLMV